MNVYIVVVKARSPNGVPHLEAVFDNREAAERWIYLISAGADAEVVEMPLYSEPLDAYKGWES